MTGYFLEFISGSCVLHQEGCFTYNHNREALAWEKREDVGAFEAPDEALRLARAKYHECTLCYCCLQPPLVPPPPPQHRRA